MKMVILIHIFDTIYKNWGIKIFSMQFYGHKFQMSEIIFLNFKIGVSSDYTTRIIPYKEYVTKMWHWNPKMWH